MIERAIVDVRTNGQGVTHRRGFLRGVTLGAAVLSGLIFTDLMAVQADELRKRQMACILLWMGGGPSQLETFDPKPGTATGGETKAIDTSVAGIKIANGWNNLAKVMNEVTVIRSMTNKEGNHERATYQLHTGYSPVATVKHPNFGCVVANEIGDPKFDLPHIVSINGGTTGAGLLGVSLEPFVVNEATKPPANAVPPFGSRRLKTRLNLLHGLERAGFERAGGIDRVRDHTSLYQQTANMVLSPSMKAFDVNGEDAKMREAYGQTRFGQGCLLARRLVESGVTFVEVRSGGWDTHVDGAEKVLKNANEVDPAFATLISDLKSRGMLDRTLVIWMGEFGRTPKINPTVGRDHFPKVFNVALAGGGIKGGQVIGSSTADGSAVKDRPIEVNDLLASFCHSLKIDPAKENMSSLGRPIKIVDGGKVVKELFA